MLNQFAFTSDFLTILLGWDKTLLPLYGSDERSTHCQLSLGLQLPAIRCQVYTCTQVPSVHKGYTFHCFIKLLVHIQLRSFCLLAAAAAAATDISRAKAASAISLFWAPASPSLVFSSPSSFSFPSATFLLCSASPLSHPPATSR